MSDTDPMPGAGEGAARALPAELLADLLELSQEAIIVRDAADRIVFWNAGAEAMYGWPRTAALGQVSHELLGTRFPTSRRDIIDTFRRDGRWEGFLAHTTRDGRELLTASRWEWRRDGARGGVTVESNRDITEERRLVDQLQQQAMELEHQLDESQALSEELEQSTAELFDRTQAAELAERRLMLVLENTPDAAALYDGHWRILYINPASAAALRAAGRDPDALVGHVVWTVFPELVGTRVHDEALRAVARQQAVSFEEQSPIDERWYETRVVPTSEGAAIFLRDITERRAAELQRARLAAIVETSDDAIISKDTNGIILSWNEGATRVFGYDAREAIGQSVLMLIPPERQHEEPQILARMRAGERTEHYQTQRRRKDGMLIDVSLSISPVRDATGAVVSVTKIARDITAQKGAEAELARVLAAEREARALAESANRAKLDFLATMSHELRTPLNAIAGYVELIELGVRGAVTDQQREDLARIRRSQQMLLGLINDVLNFARLDAKQVHYDLREVPVDAALQDIEALVRPQLQAKGLRYERIPCESTMTVWADQEKLRQIVVNLVGNAIKFTERGGAVDIRCDGDDTMTRLHVRDTGIGIPDERLADIFEPFVQVGRHLNRPSEGVGLGLAISRELARAMRGELSVESQLGVGSTFTLALPRRRPSDG